MAAQPDDWRETAPVTHTREALGAPSEPDLTVAFPSGCRAVVYDAHAARIGSGGQTRSRDWLHRGGGVFLAELAGADGESRGYFALKCVTLDDDPMQRARREAEIMLDVSDRAKALGYPEGTPRLIDYAEDEAHRFLLMDYIPGTGLNETLKDGVDLATALDLTDQLLERLEVLQTPFASARRTDGSLVTRGRLVHGDLGPSNLMTWNGRLILIDFGISFEEGEEDPSPRDPWGKVIWMPPERCLGQKDNIQSDVFGAGSILLQAITRGRYSLRRQAASSIAIACATVSGAYLDIVEELLGDRADVPEAVKQVIRRAMSPDLETRYKTAHDMRLALQATGFVPGHMIEARQRRWRTTGSNIVRLVHAYLTG